MRGLHKGAHDRAECYRQGTPALPQQLCRPPQPPTILTASPPSLPPSRSQGTHRQQPPGQQLRCDKINPAPTDSFGQQWSTIYN